MTYKKYPTGVYRCPYGDHPILLRDNGSVVPHRNERGECCSANNTIIEEDDVMNGVEKEIFD